MAHSDARKREWAINDVQEEMEASDQGGGGRCGGRRGIWMDVKERQRAYDPYHFTYERAVISKT